MSYGTLASDVIQSSTTGTPPQFNDGSGTQIGTLCRAWVNFNGANGTIRASYNVSSVTRTSTGIYTVNFTNALADANFSVSLGQSDANSGVYGSCTAFSASNVSLAYRTLINTSNVYGTYDPTSVCISVFR